MRMIDADALIKYCDDNWIPLNVDAVNAQPTADVRENVRGEWIDAEEDDELDDGEKVTFIGHRCSRCNYWKNLGNMNFCPNCGADMRRDNE